MQFDVRRRYHFYWFVTLSSFLLRILMKKVHLSQQKNSSRYNNLYGLNTEIKSLLAYRCHPLLWYLIPPCSTFRYIDRQSSGKTPHIKNTSSNNTLHIFHPFFHSTHDNPGYRKNRANIMWKVLLFDVSSIIFWAS